MPPQPKLHLPYVQWPTADRLLWERAFDDDDPFSEASGHRLAPASRYNRLMAWRRFLRFLEIYDHETLELTPPERFTPERIRAFVGHLAETNAPRSVASKVDGLYQAARMMIPERDWTWLKNIKARLFLTAPAHAANGPVITSLQLLDLGQELMDNNKPDLGTPLAKEQAMRYRDGLMVALLAFIPIRRKNLAALEIGRHLVNEGGLWSVRIPREEVKTG